MNLIGNAVKFTPHQRTVVVKLRQHESTTSFSVTDTGPGIAEADHTSVFERYWHTPSNSLARPRGTGLGLYISKGIVEAHGGKLWVESELLAGATFAFTLPRGPPASPALPR